MRLTSGLNCFGSWFAVQSRRAAMGVLAGVAALAAGAAPSQAAYGDAANVFGRVTNKSGACRLYSYHWEGLHTGAS